ncbi:hypothetical protein FNE59_07255 [Bacillus thuringiensis]|uniref:hypothetical protein n=1 Tax=Bacillus cereus group TaxID=86661 RepID=UPI001298A46D|nr:MULTISPECIES: hypothetical protein [Bacillus cereus group]MEB8860723.1 hypothetical protein [Bacillus cereus]MDA1582014.1 hypothetical protein [Bacillus cereus group sp. TH228LC]MDR5045487.1 hypothetical protein [Bacillus thuringiensis]MEB9423556.1 hypothetical protein [Bacillus cereus]MEC2468844.1 hypothetical protein [Bacillus cereus]
MDKQERIKIVNKIICEIANRGRRLFSYAEKNRTSYFASTEGQRIYYVDRYTEAKIPLFKGSRKLQERYYTRFCEGDSLLGLVMEFKDFIFGKEIEKSYLKWTHEYWGYPKEDMEAIVTFAKELGYLKS